MLVSLTLHNFLLFETAEFAFGSGLNAVSGETGAGKSLVARALGLALGGRGGQDIIRRDCDEAVIEAVFKLDKSASQDALALADSDGAIVLRRTLRRGRDGGLTSNGKTVTAQTIRKTLAPLVDFAAQNEQMRLAEPSYQLDLLDAYGKLDADADAYRVAFARADSYARRLQAGRQERELVRIRLERAKEEAADIDKMEFDPKTDPFLEDRIHEMSNAAGIVRAAAEAVAMLESGEGGESGDVAPIDALSVAWRALEKMASVSPRLAEAAEELEQALEHAQTALAKLADMAEDMEADPEQLDVMIGRSEKLKALAKRFDCEVAGLPAVREKLGLEIEDLADWDAGEDETRAKLAECLPGVAAAGIALGKKRRVAAQKLAKAVNRELAGLGMAEAGFWVDFQPLWEEGVPLGEILKAGASGLDDINFFLSPNPGEPASAIAGGVSGGEASRAVLAIKSALSEVYCPDLMFLDEVDAGVGARLGRELGVKLEGMGRSRQIIVITHLPQIAAFAGNHLKVAKQVRKGRTAAHVELLTGEMRVREIATMIHGKSANATTVQQAREMLAQGTGEEKQKG